MYLKPPLWKEWLGPRCNEHGGEHSKHESKHHESACDGGNEKKSCPSEVLKDEAMCIALITMALNEFHVRVTATCAIGVVGRVDILDQVGNQRRVGNVFVKIGVVATCEQR